MISDTILMVAFLSQIGNPVIMDADIHNHPCNRISVHFSQPNQEFTKELAEELNVESYQKIGEDSYILLYWNGKVGERNLRKIKGYGKFDQASCGG